MYFVSVTTVGTYATDWANDGVFGDGWHLLGIGDAEYNELADEYSLSTLKRDAYIEAAENAGIDTSALTAAMDAVANEEAEEVDPAVLSAFVAQAQAQNLTATAEVLGDEGQVEETLPFPWPTLKRAWPPKNPIRPITACGCPVFRC